MLFNEIVYGPIHSRRLGVSLGMNLMPLTAKLCTFDCIYCECGFNNASPDGDGPNGRKSLTLPTRSEVAAALEVKLKALQAEHITPDVITFSGNGEPTLHPEFLGIIEDTCRLRDAYCPSAKVSVLSNATQLARPDVVEALMLCDNRILKLDSAITATMRLIDQPVNADLTAERIIEMLGQFHGHFTLQTCFLRGTVSAPNPARPEAYLLGAVDNTTPEELTAWYQAVRLLKPEHIMIYVIDRATPVKDLHKISPDEMNAIARPLRDEGFDITVSC
ncbi:MAG: radical SAM protein [Paludibacteraceae bacterium]|nr:radical SAM protein [Paludibacteraceae bacterium]